MCRLIEERDGTKLVYSNINHSSSCLVNFAQTNPQISGTSTGDTTMPNPSAQPMNHFHSRTTIDSSTPTFGMPQQTMISMFRQGYMHTTPSFAIPNPGSALYTPGGNGQTYANTNGNYQASYSIVTYTNHIPLPGSSVGFLPNHTYHNTTWYNIYD
jgi:hypothetical protein